MSANTIDLTEEELIINIDELKQKEQEDTQREIEKIREEFENIQYETDMRKVFPPLDEQMAKLDPVLQVELTQMEETYGEQLKTARATREDVMRTSGSIYDANKLCSDMVRNAVDNRFNKIKELRLIWGKFFYNNDNKY